MKRLAWWGIFLMITSVSAVAQPDCPATRGRMRGELESSCEQLQHAGRSRTYRLYVPRGLERADALVVVLHGGGGSGSSMELLTRRGWNRIADRERLVVVYPDGVDRNWNDGRNDVRSKAHREGVDDVGFLRALASTLEQRFDIARERWYATGISNGGFMSLRLACEAADDVRAVAAVTAALGADLGPRCAPARPVGVAFVNGTEDPLVPWAGGTVGRFGIRRGETWSTERSFDRWRELDGCTALTAAPRIDENRDDETALIVHRATACREGVEVTLFEIEGGGHTWPRGEPYLGEFFVGRVSQEIDASAAIWEFFAAHGD